MNVNFKGKSMNVGLLKAILNEYPDSKNITFEYENGEVPVEVIIRESKYDDCKPLVFYLNDSTED